MGKHKGWPDELVAEMTALRSAGVTYKEIAAKLGRSEASIQQKISKLKKQPKQIKTIEHGSAPSPSRPMVAFVGTPSEITNAIKELFS